MQRPQIDPGAQQRIRRLCLGKGKRGGHGGETFQLGAKLCDAVQIDPGQPATVEGATGDPGRQMDDRGKGNIGILGRQRLRDLRQTQETRAMRQRKPR